MATEEPAETPPDEQRCIQSSGKRWRCKGWRLDRHSFCSYHYNQLAAKKGGRGSSSSSRSGTSRPRVSAEERGEEKTGEGNRRPRKNDEAPRSAAAVAEGDAGSMRRARLLRPMLDGASSSAEEDATSMKASPDFLM
ncbi:hypothetical protein OPV22_035069 [Ensete ventricosum]|uniref:WRC domain-containing protein n=1 Tax=Ensete ventricosum TaxID=4639 RepID=A0AAV8NYM8_ENSVE|nr:hypothetical protein OPV22_035069 [Ensete ventricosum]